MKRVLWVALVIAAVGAAAWFLFRPSSQAAESFRLVPVERGSVEQTVSTTGTLEPMVTVQVGTQVSGQVSEILVDFNDRVTEGQIIARIDPTNLESAVAQARIALRRSTADLAERKREAARVEDLFTRQLAPETDHTTAQYQLDLAEAALEAAELDLERAEQNLDYATIRAPISGIVVERSVDVGQTVAASLSAPQLFLIAADLSKMRILANVDESDVGLIDEGQKVRFTVQAYPTQRFEGVVTQIRLQPTTQDNVVSYTAVIEVDNDEKPLLPGMTATVDFLVATAENALTIANAALRYQVPEDLLARARANSRAERGEGDFGPGGDGTGAGKAASGAAGSAGSGDTAAGSGRPGASEGRDGMARGGAAPGSGTGMGTGEGSGRGGPGGSRRGGNRSFVLYLGEDGEPRIAPVRPGITDGQKTAVESPVLAEGMQVIAGTNQAAAVQSNGGSPFAPSSGSQRSGPPRPGGF